MLFDSASGAQALNSNTTGSANTAHGAARILASNTTGIYNTASGTYALYSRGLADVPAPATSG
jgi:hypothetical protein